MSFNSLWWEEHLTITLIFLLPKVQIQTAVVPLKYVHLTSDQKMNSSKIKRLFLIKLHLASGLYFSSDPALCPEKHQFKANKL